MNLKQLAHYMWFLGSAYAINLDGGRSSQMMWKKPGESVINQAGTVSNQAYPIGSIISYVLEK